MDREDEDELQEVLEMDVAINDLQKI